MNTGTLDIKMELSFKQFKKDIEKSKKFMKKARDVMEKPIKMEFANTYKNDFKDVQKQFKKVKKALEKPIKLDVDIRSALSDVRKLQRETSQNSTMRLNVDTGSALSEIRELRAEAERSATMRVNVDINGAMSDIRRLQREASSTQTMRLRVDTGGASGDIQTLLGAIQNLGSVNPNIIINTSQAESQIDGLADKLGALGGVLAGGAVVGTAWSQAATTQESASKIKAASSIKAPKEDIVQMVDRQYVKQLGEREAIADRMIAASAVTGGGKDTEKVSQFMGTMEKTHGSGSEEIGKAINSMVKNLDMSYGEAVDYLAYGVKNDLNYAGDFFDTMSEYSSQFAAAGYTPGQAMGKMITGKESGAYDTDKVGDIVKETTLRLSDVRASASTDALKTMGYKEKDIARIEKLMDSGQVKEATQSVVSDLAKVKDEGKRLTMMATLLGTQAEDLTAGVTEKIMMSDKTVQQSEYEGSASKLLNETNDNPTTQLKEQWTELLIAMRPLGEHLIKMATAILPPVVAVVSTLSDWFVGLSDAGKTATVVIGGLVTALGGFGLIGGVIKKLKGSTVPPIIPPGGGPGGGPGTSKWDKFKNFAGKAGKIAGKVGGRATPLAGVAIGGYNMLTADNEQERNEAGGSMVGGLAGGLTGAAIGTAIMPIIGTAIGGIIGGIGGAIGGEKIVKNWDTIKEKWSSGREAEKERTKEQGRKIKETVSGKYNDVKDKWSEGSEKAKEQVEKMKETYASLKESLTTKSQEIFAGVATTWDSLTAKMSEVGTGIWTSVTTTWDGIKTKVSEVSTGIWTSVTTTWDGMMTKITEVGTGIWTSVTTTWDGVKAKVSEVGTNMLTSVQTAWGSMVTAIVEKGVMIKASAKSIWDNIVSGVQNIVPNMIDTGSNLIAGLWTGMKSKIADLKANVADMAGGLVKFVNGKFDIHSPSRVFAKTGGYLTDGIRVGMQSKASNLYKATSKITSNVTKASTKAVSSGPRINPTTKSYPLTSLAKPKVMPASRDNKVVQQAKKATTLAKKTVAPAKKATITAKKTTTTAKKAVTTTKKATTLVKKATTPAKAKEKAATKTATPLTALNNAPVVLPYGLVLSQIVTSLHAIEGMVAKAFKMDVSKILKERDATADSQVNAHATINGSNATGQIVNNNTFNFGSGSEGLSKRQKEELIREIDKLGLR